MVASPEISRVKIIYNLRKVISIFPEIIAGIVNFQNDLTGDFLTEQTVQNKCAFAYKDTFQMLLQHLHGRLIMQVRKTYVPCDEMHKYGKPSYELPTVENASMENASTKLQRWKM